MRNFLKLARALILSGVLALSPVLAPLAHAGGLINPYRLAVSGSPSYVSKVSYYSLTLNSTSGPSSDGLQATAAVSPAVDTSKSFLVILGEKSSATSTAPSATDVRVELTNSSTITAYRTTSSTVQVTVDVALVEATDNLVESVQQGVITFTGTTATQDVTAVDTTRSAVFYLGQTHNSGSQSTSRQISGITLTDADTLTANTGVSATINLGYVLVQFQDAAIKSRQQISDAYATADTTDFKTLGTTVDPNNTMIAFGGIKNGSSPAYDARYRIRLTSGSNVDLIRFGTSVTSRTPYYTVLEFEPGVLASAVQRPTIDMAGVNSNTAAISPSVNASKTLLNYTGWNTDKATAQPTAAWVTQTLTSGSVATGSTWTATVNGSIGNEVLEFN